MSQTLYIYKVSKVKGPLPSLINLDSDNPDLEHTEASRAEDWEKEIGTPTTIEYKKLDQFDACKKMFGKEPCSISYRPSYRDDGNDYMVARFPDGTSTTFSSKDNEKYYFTYTTEAFFFNKETVVIIDSAYSIPYQDYVGRLLKKEDILRIVERYYRENDDLDAEYNYYTAPVFQLMKAYVTDMADDEYFVLESD